MLLSPDASQKRGDGCMGFGPAAAAAAAAAASRERWLCYLANADGLIQRRARAWRWGKQAAFDAARLVHRVRIAFIETESSLTEVVGTTFAVAKSCPICLPMNTQGFTCLSPY